MSRLRGPKTVMPEGEAARRFLNVRLFGAADVGGHHVALQSDVGPFDWAAEFGRDAPRTLEIGFNRGRFIQHMAAAWPDHDHVGIEIQRRFAWLLANRIVEEGSAPENLRIIWADAKLVTQALFEPQSLDAIFINFPDPWWKKRHHKRRLVDESFAQDLARLLVPGGRVWVKSDVPDIAGEIDQALASVASLEGPHPFEEDTLPLTFREVKCVRQGLPITRFWYTRTA